MKFTLLDKFTKKFSEAAGSIPAVFLAMAILLISQPAFSQSRPNNFRTIHVKFKEQFRPKSASSGQSARSGITGIDKVSEKHKALSIERIFPDAGVYEAAHKAYGLHLWYEIKFSKDASLHEAIADYQNLDYFHNVEECTEYTASWETDSALPELPAGTNDVLFSKQWHFKNTGQTGGKPGADINLLKAWQVETGSPNVIVAVIDGGIDLYHPDLVDALWTNSDEIPNNKIDDDHNGYVDDVHGYGFGDKTPIIYPRDHATHVAGTIGAVSNNGIGVSGIAGGSGSGNGVRLMSCAAFGNFNTGGFEAAMVYAADNGAVISQNSWGGGTKAIEEAIAYFVNRAGYDNSEANFLSNIQTGPMAGGLVIFAAGNLNTSSTYYSYPASYASVIAVASTDHRDVKSAFSNYGTWVDIAAPGTGVFSTHGSGYALLSGTSMACPHVSGVAALVISNLQRPGLYPSEVWNRLRLSAHSISAENPSMNGLLGAGRLDAFVSLQEPDAIPPAAIIDLHATEIHSSSVVLGWTATGASGNIGQAAEYEIRYSTSPITVSNFNNATLASNPPIPPTAGEQVIFRLENLISSTTYYVALKSKDLFNNTSGISNIRVVNTPEPGAPEVITTSLSAQLYTGAISSREILVRNTGEDDLSIRLGVPDISPAPVGLPTGAKGRLFAVNTLQNSIDEIDPKTGALIGSIPMPEPSSKSSEGLAFDGVNLYYGRSKIIYKLNAQTGQVLRSFTLNDVSTIRGIGWSGRYLYISAHMVNGSGYKIFEVNSDNGTILKTFSDLPVTELTFAGSRGTLFIEDGELIEASIETGNVIRRIQIGVNPGGLAYSEGENVIFVSEESSIKAIQPDTGEVLYSLPYLPSTALAADEYRPSWLKTEEKVITIAPGATSSVPVTFVATGLPTGQWTGTVNVIPINTSLSPITIPVTLNVTSAPDIETASEIDLGPQFLGYTIDTVISVENRGISDLIISNVHSNDSRVTSSLATVTLAPGQKVSISVTITPAVAGPIDASLTFSSNDPDEGVVLIPVRAAIFISPAIQLNPVSLSTTMSTGESKALNFTAKNSGGSVLHWKVNFAGSGLPGFSQSGVEQSDFPNPSDSAYLSGVGEFTVKAQSPEQLTCLSYDPQSGFIYAKSLVGTSFYRYDPVADNWATMGLTPGAFVGQAAYLNGKIYHPGVQLSVYTIATNSWTTVPFPVQTETGNVTSDGHYIYMNLGPAPPSGAAFYRYDPIVNSWVRLAAIPRDIYTYGGLSYHSGVIYAHEDATTGFTGDGNTKFFKYYIASDSWITSMSIPGKECAGSTIDPAGRKYFVVGAPYARPGMGVQMSILDLTEGEWQRIETPFTVGSHSGLVFVGKFGFSGVYLIQGNGGKGFARYETSPAAEWISITPSQGNLAPGATQTFTVDLNAAGMDGGTYTGNLSVYSNHPSIERTVPLTVTVLGTPKISMNAATTDLGETLIGQEKGATLTIKNIGTAPLIVSNITTDRPDFDIFSNLPFTVQTGESIDVGALFRPTTAGPQTGTFTFHNNDPDDGSIQFVLKGKGVYPPIPGITSGSMTAHLLTGAKSVQQIIISNEGGSTMDYVINFDPAWDWLKEWTYGDLASGQTKTIDITIDAGGKPTGTYVGKIIFTHHAELQAEIPVTMTVTGAADILTSKKSISFGDQFINYSYDSIIQIKNDGVLPLSISTINSDNPAFSISATAPINLEPGESINATVRFNPTTVSTQSGLITITSDDPDEGTYVIPLSGNAIDPPLLTSNPAALTASAFTNDSQTQSLTLINDGGSVLKWRIIEQSNPHPTSNEDGRAEQPMSAGDFTSHGPTPEKLISPVVNPASGLLYAQGPHDQMLHIYNPLSRHWSAGEFPPGIGSFESGGAVFLNSRMYCVYPENNSTILVYNPTLADWTSIPNGLGAGTGTITTDGTLLYLAGGGNFKSLNPKSGKWTDLSLPTISLNGIGGLSHYNGIIYAHEGGGNGFAKYTIATGIWENLVPLPDRALLGSAIDPVRKRYYAYGGNYLYEYDIASNLWSVQTFTLFESSEGGLVYTAKSDAEGIYFIQGKSGTGLGRYEPKAELTWLRTSPLTGEIPASGSQTLGINFNAYGLNTGMYKGIVQAISNDPTKSMMEIPVTFHVTNPGPTIEVPTQISDTLERSTLYTTQLKIENKGPGLLQWSFADVLPDWLAVSKFSGELSGLSFETITVTFDPRLFTPDVLDYSLQVASNDVFNPTVSTRLSFTIITNHAPIVSSLIATQSLTNSVHFSLQENFFDQDNDPLAFSATSGNTDVISVKVSGSMLSVYPITPGTASITVTATDIFNLSATTSFTAYVNQHVTAIERVPTEAPFLAIPNPFEKDVTLRYNAETPGLATIFIFDISGKIVWQANAFEEVHGRNEVEINGNQLVPGIYNCRLLRNGDLISTVRLVRY